MSKTKQKQKLYISFVNEDLTAFKKFRKHLSLLEQQGMVEIWSKEDLRPGLSESAEMKRQLNQADIILFLVSIELLTNPDTRKIELKVALERVKEDNTPVVPVLYRRCTWSLTPLGQFAPSPKNGKFINLWEDEDDAWTTVVEEIHELLESRNQDD